MLVPFSIDPDAVSSGTDDLSLRMALHSRVVREWRAHGVFVHSSGALRDSDFVKSIDALPQGLRKLWKTALSYNRRRPASVAWNGAFPNDHVSELMTLKQQFSVALLDPIRSVAVCGLAEDESSRIEPTLDDMELCKFHSVGESKCFRLASDLSERALRPGDNCAAEWERRYSDFVRYADQITVVDRYVFANHLWRISSGEESGLRRLLDDCFKRSRERPVNIKMFFAIQCGEAAPTAEDEAKIEAFVHALGSRYLGGGIRKIELYMLTDQAFAAHAHARYFRADYQVFGVDAGLDSFGGKLARRGTLVWRHDTLASNAFAEQEAALTGAAFRRFNVL